MDIYTDGSAAAPSGLSLLSGRSLRRQRIGTRVGIRGTVSVCNGRDNIFVLRERKESHELFAIQAAIGAICLFRNKRISRNSLASLFPTLALSRCARFSYLSLSIYLSACASLYFRLLVSLSRRPYFFAGDSPLARLRFSFIKLIAPTKPKKHVVWGVTREYRVGKHGNVDRP